MMTSTYRSVALMLVLVILAGCASSSIEQRHKTLIATAQVIDSASIQFAEVGRLYNSMLDAKQVTPEEYRRWAEFAQRFKATFPVLATGWKAAAVANDSQSLESLEKILTPLLTELSVLALQLTKKVQRPVPTAK